jgi:hypothetical protein
MPEPFDTIWSYGLRNPYRFSFDRSTGKMAIGDVGQEAREEVDVAPRPPLGAGANFGWNCREGFLAGPATDPGCETLPPASLVPPVLDYPHTYVNEDNGAHACAVIGGYVDRANDAWELGNRYVYGDLCTGEIRSFCPSAPAATDRWEKALVPGLDSFGEDAAGHIYAVTSNGGVLRLAGTDVGAPATCDVAPKPTTTTPPVTLKASFVGIQALRATVPKNRRTMVTAWVSPCEGRRGQPVTLWQGPRRIGVRHLDRVCTVRFRPKIRRLTRFRATVREDVAYQGAISRRLTIRIDHRPRYRRKHRSRLLSSLDSASGWTKAPSTR